MRRARLSIVAVACLLALWTSTLSAQEKVLDGLQYGGRATTMLGCLEDSAKLRKGARPEVLDVAEILDLALQS